MHAAAVAGAQNQLVLQKNKQKKSKETCFAYLVRGQNSKHMSILTPALQSLISSSAVKAADVKCFQAQQYRNIFFLFFTTTNKK